jgi:hypothetical protein
LLILLHPVLDRGIVRDIFLGVLGFVPVILATIRLSQIKGWLWQSLLTGSRYCDLLIGGPVLAESSIQHNQVGILWPCTLGLCLRRFRAQVVHAWDGNE